MIRIKDLLKSMTLKEKVGQLFQIGFSSTEVTGEIREMIEEYNIGGIIYFSRNIESLQQTAALSKKLQNIAHKTKRSLPLIISTDQEGGIVTRLKGGVHFPGHMALGAAGSERLAYQAGKAIARELKYVGINMDLAPVLDVNNNPENPVIGVRSFGEDPVLVAKLGSAYIKGLQEEGIIACGKHFPGHGDTDTDSHFDLPVIMSDRSRLAEVELYPFRQAIKNNLDSIMTAHVYFPAIEKKDGLPATLSTAVLTGLLREELGFEGLIITDCMEMDAIVNTFGTVEGAVMTLKAGSDMVLISHTIEKAKKAIRAVIKAVEQGRISQEEINKSVERVMKLKLNRIGDTTVNKEYYDLKREKKVAYKIAKKSVTLVKDENKLIPITNPVSILVCDFNMGRIALVEDDKFHENLLVGYLEKEGFSVKYHTFKNEKMEISNISKYDLIVACTYNAVADQKQVNIVKQLKKQSEKLLVLSIRNPYDINVLPGIKAFMTIYDYSSVNYQAASEVISGKIKPVGKLPVTIKRKNKL